MPSLQYMFALQGPIRLEVLHQCLTPVKCVSIVNCQITVIQEDQLDVSIEQVLRLSEGYNIFIFLMKFEQMETGNWKLGEGFP